MSTSDGRNRRRRDPRDDRRVPPREGRRPRLALRARARPRRARRLVRLRRPPVDRFYHVVLPTDDRVRGLADELGFTEDDWRFRPTKVGFYGDGHLFSMTSPREFLTLPAAARARPRSASARFVVRCQLTKGYDALDDEPLLEWLRRTSGPRVTERCGSRCSTRSSTGATTTCPRPTSGRGRSACRRRATRAAARSWAGSRAATSGSSTRSPSGSSSSAARSGRDAPSSASCPRADVPTGSSSTAPSAHSTRCSARSRRRRRARCSTTSCWPRRPATTRATSASSACCCGRAGASARTTTSTSPTGACR